MRCVLHVPTYEEHLSRAEHSDNINLWLVTNLINLFVDREWSSVVVVVVVVVLVVVVVVVVIVVSTDWQLVPNRLEVDYGGNSMRKSTSETLSD